MHGLINTALQVFVTETYGRDRWIAVTERADLGFVDFESMLNYTTEQTDAVLDALPVDLGRPLNDVLEDLGTFLVSHPRMESLRRLLRFSGDTYMDFLFSLDDLPDRARLAVGDLVLPALDVQQGQDARFCLFCHAGLPGYGAVMMGVLRAMADDYGALVFLEYKGQKDGVEHICITLVEAAFAEGREFDLGAWG